MSYRQSFTVLVLLSLLVLAVSPAVFAEGDLCDGFAKKDRISRLAGPHAFSKKAVASPADLLAQLQEHRAEIQAILDARGLGHLTDGLLAAVESGRGLSERDLVRGETFEWMVSRQKTGPVAAGPVCIATKKTYSAYEIQVSEESSTAAKASCKVDAKGTVVGEPLSVSAAGSSPGVEVTMAGPDGATQTIISGGSSTWSGTPEKAGTYTFTAHAKTQGSQTVTTHTFVVPKICLNLSYDGKKSEERPGEPDSCTSGPVKVEIVDPAPECQLQAPGEVPRKQSFTVGGTGRYDELTVRIVDEKGRTVQAYDDAGKPLSTVTPPQSIYLKKSGTYTLEGTATNRVGSASCTATLTVTRPEMADWTLRAFALNLDPDDDGVFRSSFRPNGVNERSEVSLDGGEGLGVGVEYHFNEKIGLEASLLWADVDAVLFFDLDEAWAQDEAGASFLALAVGPNFHLTPQSRVDFYVGVFAGWAQVDDASFSVLGENVDRGFGDDFFLGAQLGLDVPFGQRDWGLHVGARYLDLTVDQDDAEIDVNPLIAEIGLFFHF